jgi:hypothetical protein
VSQTIGTPAEWTPAKAHPTSASKLSVAATSGAKALVDASFGQQALDEFLSAGGGMREIPRPTQSSSAAIPAGAIERPKACHCGSENQR